MNVFALVSLFVVMSVVSVCLFVVNAKSGRIKQLELEKDKLASENQFLKEKMTALETGKSTLEKQVEDLMKKKDEFLMENTALREKQSSLSATVALLQEKEKSLEDLKLFQERAMVQMKESFKVLSQENAHDFKNKSKSAISEIMQPVAEKFSEFSKAVKESQQQSLVTHSKLEQKITDLENSSKKVSDDAKNLAKAITGQSKIQGNFGEMLLIDLLKASGMQEGITFFSQKIMTDENGNEIKSDENKRMIPDITIINPDNTAVIVDSKVSLKDYVNYVNTDNEEDRVKYAKAHVQSILRHVEELRKKDYASYLSAGMKKVNYNIMFVPVEGAFRLMQEQEPTLWQSAKENNVLIVSHLSLMLFLDMINMTWKQYRQQENIDNVYKTAQELMSRLKSWMEQYSKVGDFLEKAMASYSDSKRKLSESNQSVIKKIAKLEELGLQPKKNTGKIKIGNRVEKSIIPATLGTNSHEECEEQEQEQ